MSIMAFVGLVVGLALLPLEAVIRIFLTLNHSFYFSLLFAPTNSFFLIMFSLS